jgi:hypothetical protein
LTTATGVFKEDVRLILVEFAEENNVLRVCLEGQVSTREQQMREGNLYDPVPKVHGNAPGIQYPKEFD